MAFTVGTVVPVILLACLSSAQPAFEVASVKPSDPNPTNPMWTGMNADPGMVRYSNLTLKDCIRAAYRVRDFQIEGPDWISTARYEIIARLPDGATPDQIPDMLRTLIAARFKLTLNQEKKDLAVYALTIGKGGPKLKPATTPTDNAPTAIGPDGKPRAAMLFGFTASGMRLKAPAANLATFVELMSRFTERPVVDVTGLAGLWDLELVITPETYRGVPATMQRPSEAQAAESQPAPSIFDAVEQLGLKLEPRKLPLDVLTIVHAERTPTEN
jgi:uncharacterized protein (TIGR03435 family)